MTIPWSGNTWSTATNRAGASRPCREFHWPVPEAQRVLLNWRGGPFSYRYVSFSDVFQDLTSKEKRRPSNEFAGKIIIIGSTAPSLFDFRPTPMSQMHPGVEILATAIDNFKHGDYLRFPEAPIPYLLLSLAIVWVTAWNFYRGVNPIILDWWFGLSQCCLVGVSYASINVSTVYINLTGPVSLGLAYFSVTRTYAALTRKSLDRSMVRVSREQAGERQAALLLIRVDTEEISDIGWEYIRVGLLRAGAEAKTVELLFGDQKGFWELCEKTFAVLWLAPMEDATARTRITADIEAVLAAFPGLLRKVLVNVDGVASWFSHHGTITCGESAEDSWRALFAETLAQWHISTVGKGKT
ncbi:CHASE2 domain-containing protein [Candidatus Ozemobacteraceae bacterium]|nr:CHASE2 domain-containing protein [Candidatus Ozemobacteraceae bacterium]